MFECAAMQPVHEHVRACYPKQLEVGPCNVALADLGLARPSWAIVRV